MVTRLQHAGRGLASAKDAKAEKVKAIKVEFADESISGFGGLALAERLALRAGLWRRLERLLPERRGYDWLVIVKSVVMGLLSGSRGTFAAQELREDRSLITLLGLENVPEEVTVWRSLEALGGPDLRERLARALQEWSIEILSRAVRRDLLVDGFVPVFADGTLLEGSRRREGTKYEDDKGWGLMWTGVFVGPMLCAQHLSGEGEGEQAAVRELLPRVVEQILEPLNLKEAALLLLDSLHGDGPTLDLVEGHGLRYIAGANKLSQTARVLDDQPDVVWQSTGARPELHWEESAICVCWLQCEDWPEKRQLIGRRWRKAGEMIYHYSGVVSNLTAADLSSQIKSGSSFAQAIWRLYDYKAGMENYFKDLLEDLGLHHPPCQEHARNAGFYALASLACVLGRGVDLIGGRSSERGSTVRQDGRRRKRARPRRMRLWRLRRRLFSLPGRIASHARRITLTLLGLSGRLREEFERYWQALSSC